MLIQELRERGTREGDSEIHFANVMPKQKIISVNGLYQGLLSDKPNEIWEASKQDGKLYQGGNEQIVYLAVIRRRRCQAHICSQHKEPMSCPE